MEQIEFGTPVHLALEQFQAVHLPFGLPLTPRQLEGSGHRVKVTTDAIGEADQFRDRTCGSCGELGIKLSADRATTVRLVVRLIQVDQPVLLQGSTVS